MANRTFWTLVAKWPCQNHVIRSGNGRSAAAIRSSHQPTSWVRCCCSACADAGSFGMRSTGANDGRGCGGGPGVGPGRGEGVERGVEPGGRGGVQLAPARAEPQSLEQAADGVALTDRGHLVIVTRKCSSSVRNRAWGSSEARTSRGIPWEAWPARSDFCSSRCSPCSGGARARHRRGRGRRPSTYTTSLAALQDKVDSIAQDSCTTRPAVQAYPDCARYVAEVGNAALATQGAAASVNGADALQTTAARLADEVGLFSRTGCVAAPGVAGPPAQVCGDALRKIQVDLTAMRTQLAAAPPAP